MKNPLSLFSFLSLIAGLLPFFLPSTSLAHSRCQHLLGADFFLEVEEVPTKPNNDLFPVELHPFLGLSFLASSTEMTDSNTVYLETEQSRTLSQIYGEKIVSQAIFSTTPQEALVTLPFKSMSFVRLQSGEELNEAPLDPSSESFKIERLYFKSTATLKIIKHKVEMLPLHSIADLESNNAANMNLASFLFFRGTELDEGVEQNTINTISRILKKGFENMKTPYIQKEVVQIIHQGESSIESHLNEIGLTLGKTVKQAVPQKQWAHTMGQKKKHESGHAFQYYPVMVEGGRLALSHGAYAHHAQLMAFFWNMPHEDCRFFIEALMKKQRSDNESDWYAWVTLFDGDNTETPLTAFFWHKKINSIHPQK